jgi:hypothetical protein
LNDASLKDERLLIEAAQHDPSRFAELYENNFHRVYAFVARRVSDRDEAQDITAEVFIRRSEILAASSGEACRLLRGFCGSPRMHWLTDGSVPHAALRCRRKIRWRSVRNRTQAARQKLSDAPFSSS